MIKIKRRYYSVAIARNTNGTIDPRTKSFKVLNNGKGFWVADPFPVEKDGKLYIFGEMYEFNKVKGAICYGIVERDTERVVWKKIIEEEYHLSFPYVFLHEGTYYMCPESHKAQSLYLYKCTHFPDRWVKCREIAKGNYNDTIYYVQDKNVFGFTCVWNGLEDHLFSVFKLSNDGIYEAPKENVRTIDYYMTRPAGKIINDSRNRRSIIVSQICKPKYGSGLVFKEFDLSWPQYSEKEIFRCLPNEIMTDKKNKYDGIHTYNLSDNYMVIDLLETKTNITETLFRIINKIKKLV